MAAVNVLFVGIKSDLQAAVMPPLKGVTTSYCRNSNDFQEIINNGATVPAQIIICGADLAGVAVTELAQAMRMLYPDGRVLYVVDKTEGFDRKLLVKNGFGDAFLLPMDTDELHRTLAQAMIEAEHGIYSPVRLVDIEPGTKLGFDISLFLPTNNRFLLYSAAGDVMDPKRLDRLKQAKHNSVYIPADQLSAFYEYSAQRLINLSKGPNAISETERTEKLRSSVRELLTGMLSESYSRTLGTGKKTIDHTRKIVDKFIMLNNPDDWYTRMASQVGEKGDAYTHSSAVAVYAVLFSLALGIGQPEELAIAALFHDLGVTELPAEIQNKRPEEMSAEEMTAYRTHPELSIKIMQARRMIVPDVVIRTILNHHEKWNGKGYPKGLKERTLSPESQILALADRFDYLTRAESNVAPLEPEQALRQIEADMLVNPVYIGSLKRLISVQKAA